MTETYLNNDGYAIKLADLTQKELKLITKELTIIPNEKDLTEKECEIVKYKLYEKTNKYIIVPRYYGIEKFGKPTNIRFNPEKRAFKFTGTLRDYQIPIVEKCLNDIIDTGGGLLSVPCGEGKTTMALYLGNKLKIDDQPLKILVVVHKTRLLNQWIERAEQFTDAKIGIMRQNIINVDGCDIVIAMLQSLSKKTYDPEIFKQFGLVIYDECHHIVSKGFSRALKKTCVKYTLGLSATPYRNDGLIHIMHWYIGSTLYQKKLKTNNQVSAKIITFHSTDNEFAETKRYIKKRGLTHDWVGMLTTLTKIESRNIHINNIILNLIKNPLRQILVLSHRIEHLIILKTEIDKILKENKTNNNDEKNEEKEITTSYYTGQLTEREKTYAEKYGDILFATYDMAHEGLDISRLNTIVLATPKKDVVQSIGRILRTILKKNGIRPLVIDIKDNLPLFIRHGDIRETFYTNSKYNLEYHYINNDKYISSKKYAELKGFEGNFSQEYSENLDEILYVTPIDIISENSDNKSNNTTSTKTTNILNKRLF